MSFKFMTPIPVAYLYPPVAAPWEFNGTTEQMLRAIKKADEAGFDMMNMPDHIVMPKESLDLMSPRWGEAVTTMAFMAGATQNLRVYTTILIMPYRNPFLLAKALATLDFLSGGRVTLGTAIGHEEREFELLGVPFNERAAITDEYINVLRELWTNPDPQYHGKYVDFENVAFEPRPVQKPTIPIIIGGNSRPAQRRAARLGDGWHPWLVTRKELPSCIDYIKNQPEFVANPRPFEVFMPLAPINVDEDHVPLGETKIPFEKAQLIAEVEELISVGATGCIVSIPPTDTFEEYLEKMEYFGKEVLPRFKKQPATA